MISSRLPLSALLACVSTVACAAGFTMKDDIAGRECASLLAARDGSIQWVVPSSDERALDRWCAAVGEPVIRQSRTRSAKSPRGNDSIRIVSWNVSLGGGEVVPLLEELGVSCTGTDRDQRDVVLLAQEAVRRSDALPWMNGNVRHQRRLDGHPVRSPQMDILDAADRCDLHLVYVPGSRNGGEQDGPPEDVGNAILSTLPLSDPFAVEMPKEASRRVAAGATIRGHGGEGIRVVSVHFNTWPGPWKLLRTGNSSRVRQALALIEALEVVARGSEHQIPIVAGGDLNTWSVSEGALKQLRAYFSSSPEWHGQPTRKSFPTDHLLLRLPSGGASLSADLALVDYGRLDETFNSDHHPVTAWMTWTAVYD
jgi:hypothetical protein